MSQPFSVLIGILSGFLGASLVWGIQTLTCQNPSSIAALNVRALMNEEITRVAKSNLTAQQAAEQVKQYAARLSKGIENVAQEQNLVILPVQAVMAGAIDITALIQKQVSNEPVL